MAESKSIQVKMPPKTYEKLVQFTGSEGFIGSSGKPIVSQAVLKMIRFFFGHRARSRMGNTSREIWRKHVWNGGLSCDRTYQKTAKR